MHNIKYPSPPIIIGLLCLLIVSCNNKPADVPLPPGIANYAQPKSQLLAFTTPKKIAWDTTKKGGLHPLIKTFDINTLPALNYDAADFVPFSQPPTQATFNFNTLQSRPFNLDSLPAKSFNFKKLGILLGIPGRVRSGLPVAKPGNRLAISTLGAAQGIPGKLVTAMLKDKNGLMWVATEEGLFRYNGEVVQAFLPRPTFLIAGLMQDNNGNIWFISNAGLRMFNPSTGMGYRCDEVKSKVNDLAYMMKDDQGNIWITNLLAKNVVVVNPAKETYTTIDVKAGLSDSAVMGATQDAAKNIWVSSLKGFTIFNLHTNTVKYMGRGDGLGADTLIMAATDSSGHIWFGAHAQAAGNTIKDMDIKAGTITSYLNPNMQDTRLLEIMAGGKNRLWLGTTDGIVILDPQQKTAKYIDQKSGLNDLNVLSLVRDNSGRVWAGTPKGLNIIEQDADLVYPVDNAATNTMLEGLGENIWIGTNFSVRIVDTHKKLIRYFNTQHGLSHNLVQSFNLIDSNMWVTSDGGLDIINTNNKTIEHYGRAEGLANDTVYSVLKTTKGDIWFTAPSAGIDVIDSTKTFIRHLNAASGLNSDDIADVKEDKDGLVWLATRTSGLDIVDVDNNTVKYLNNVPGLMGTSNNILLYDKRGLMWIGTYKGIYVADTKTNTITTISIAEGLPEDKITSLLEHNGKIYAATAKNVTIITPPASTGGQWVVEQLANTEGLTKEVTNTWSCNAITAKGQYLWGDSGVTIINNLAGYSYTNPTYITGVQINNEQGDFLTLNKSALPDSIGWQDSFYAKSMIVGLPMFKKEGVEWDSVAGPYNMPANLHIAYNKNYLQFQFVQPHTGGKVAPVYKYILLGIDKQWSEETTNTFTQNYLNLPPGTYTFKVISKGANNKWGLPDSFSFTITPPWWKTWWAYTAYVLLLSFAIWQFIQYRSRRLVAENQLLEEKVKQRTDALQHSLEELKTTQSQLVQSEKMASLGELTAGIAHEIQNPLNFVNNFSEVSIELVDELKEELGKATLGNDVKGNIDDLLDDLVQNQQKINYHGKRADSIVKGMLQHSRSGSGQKEMVDINVLADEYLRLSYHGLRAKDKTFNAKLETSFADNLPKLHILMQDMGRVLLNLYTNAFYSVMKKKKEAGGDYQPTVMVSTSRKNNHVEIRVRDNGMGIPQAVLDKIYNPFFTTKPTGEGTGLGLSLSYEIVTKGHGGTINAETREGEFAEFIITLPVNH